MRKTTPSLWLLPHDPVTTHKDMQGALSMPQRLSLEQCQVGEPAPEKGQPEPKGAQRNESALRRQTRTLPSVKYNKYTSVHPLHSGLGLFDPPQELRGIISETK